MFTPPQLSNEALNNLPPQRALIWMRIIWAALLAGPLIFMGVVAFQMPGEPKGAESLQLLVLVNAIMLLTLVPAMWIVRHHLHRRDRREDGSLPAQSYSSGNIIFWGACEATAFFGIVTAMQRQTFWPTILFVAAALALELLTYPRLSGFRPHD